MLSIQFVQWPLHGVRPSPRRRRRTLMAAAFVALAAVGTLWADGSAAAAEAVIKISDFSFAPAQLTVPVGTTVTWVNDDDEPHTVVDSNTLFKSHALDAGDKFSFTFTTQGKFQYFCTIHAHMVGTVVVQ